MELAHDQEILMRRDAAETLAAKSLAKWAKVAICAAVVLGVLGAVLAVEIGLLSSGSLIVVMPE